MREDLADLVHAILDRGLHAKEQLTRGEVPDLLTVRTALKDLLLTELDSANPIDMTGEADSARSISREEHQTKPFLGARYALVCWLDEIFTSDPKWGQAWNERKLESEMYGSNDRAWRFWEQADLAQTRPTVDALEVFFWCVMLGFRGQNRSRPEQLQSWTSATRSKLGYVEELSWPYSPGLAPVGNAVPLRGWERLRKVILVGWGVVLLLLPILAFFLVRNAGS